MIEELKLIESCIERMARNSFLIKGWSISIFVAILALLPESIEIVFVCVAGILATCIFWSLDAYYLQLERLFRLKYQWVINYRKSTYAYLYDLNPNNKEMRYSDSDDTHISFWKVFFSKSLLLMYSVMILFYLVLFVLEVLHGAEETSGILQFSLFAR